MRNYEKDYEAYMAQVMDGTIPACHWVKKAVERQIKDIERWKDTSGAYRWVPFEGARICAFIEKLTHTKGDLGGQKIHLEPWQVWILMVTFGWRTPEGKRRFRRVYIEVPRGNGKSCLSSGVALFCLLCDREPGAEVYSFATTRDQAAIVFKDAQQMVRQSPQLQKKFGVQLTSHALFVLETNSTFQAKSADASTLDGLNTHFACIDELHAHKDRGVFDVVATSLGKRSNNLLWAITTAGIDTAGICFEVRTFVCRILNESVEDETQFGIVYTIDEGDDWRLESSARKANPNWGVSVQPDVIMTSINQAVQSPSAVNNVKTKHLNVWCSAAANWMNMTAWNQCANPELRIEQFYGKPCYIGLDMATKSDMTAKTYLFPEWDAQRRKNRYTIFCQFYLCEEAIKTSLNSQYEGWVSEGFVETTPGHSLDYDVVYDGLVEDAKLFDVKGVAYDPWNCHDLMKRLDQTTKLSLIEYRPGYQTYSDPCKWLEAFTLDGLIAHDGNPVLSWMVGNVVVKYDRNGNIYPVKPKENLKIDGVIGAISALGIAMAEKPKPNISAFAYGAIVI